MSLGKNLLDNDLIWLTIAVYLGAVVQNFFSSLTRDVLSPLFFAAFGSHTGLEHYTVTLGGQHLLLGDLAGRFLELAVAIILVVVTIESIRIL